MESSLESSVRAISASYARLETISSNIANQSTQGYKRKILVSQMPQDFAQAMTAQSIDAARMTVTDMRPGTLKVTGRNLDITLAQDHYLTVRSPTGLQYVRGGSLQISASGQLVTATGNPVQGKQGDIYLTTDEVRIDGQGRIFERDREVSHLSITRLAAEHLLPSTDAAAYITKREGAMETQSVAADAVGQGQVEMSNVNVTREMISMIETVRQAEAMHKAAQGYEQMMQTAVRTLGGL